MVCRGGAQGHAELGVTFVQAFLDPRADAGGADPRAPEEGQADVFLHPLPQLHSAEDLLP